MYIDWSDEESKRIDENERALRESTRRRFSRNDGQLVCFVTPPYWRMETDDEQYSRQCQFILYAHQNCLSALSNLCIGGKVASIIAYLKNNNNCINDGYNRSNPPPTNTNISPLQISCAEYIATREQRYLSIITQLIYYGSNIHLSSSFIDQSLDKIQSEIRKKENATRALQSLSTKTQTQYLAECERIRSNNPNSVNSDLIKNETPKLKSLKSIRHKTQKAILKHHVQLTLLRQREQLYLGEMAPTLNAVVIPPMNGQISSEERQRRFRARFRPKGTVTSNINDSTYVMAIKDRRWNSDQSLLEAIISGKKMIAVVVKTSFVTVGSEEISECAVDEMVQIIVSFVVGI